MAFNGLKDEFTLFGQKHDTGPERKEQDERNRLLVSIITKGEK